MEKAAKEKENVLTFVSAMLGHCRKPLREEQVWALCYECCCRMERPACGPRQKLRPVPVQLTASGPLVIHKDGSVAFTAGLSTGKAVKTDREIIYCLAWMLYNAIDSQIPDDREPDLSPPLERLLCAMLGLSCSNTKSGKNLQQKCTYKAIIEACEKRFINPLEAENHYRKVCREFTEQANICKTLQTGAGKLCPKTWSALNVVQPMTLKDWEVGPSNELQEILALAATLQYYFGRKMVLQGFLWSNVVKELQNGIRLQNVSERLFCTLPIEYKLTPFEHLMDDIRYKRYTLQKVTACASKRKSIHASLLDLICSRPTLKPVSERKLKERSWEEPSLHELLMTEIKSTKKLRTCRSMEVKREAPGFVARTATWLANQSENCALAGGLFNDDWLCKEARTPLIDQDDTGLPFDGIPCWRLEYTSAESSSDHAISISNSPELDADLVFMPVLTSSQIDMKIGKNKSGFHQRSKSLQSSFQHKDHVCFSCHKKKVFFTWPYECHVCDRSVCPECCTKMLLPFKLCIHLPVTFLKIVRLDRYDDPDSLFEQSDVFWEVAEQWDCSRVPVVFEPHKRGDDCMCHQKKNIRNWFSMDLCTKCKEYLLDHISIHQKCRIFEEQPRMRTILESCRT